MSDKNYTTTPALYNPKSSAPAVYIPYWLIQVPTKLLSNNAKILYGRLSQWCNESGDVYRSAPELSEELGSPVRNIVRWLTELKESNLILTYQPQAGGKNHFQFLKHEWMNIPINNKLIYSDPATETTQEVQSYQQDPTPKMERPHAKNGATPTPKMARININKIKTNKKEKDNSINFEKTEKKPSPEHQKTFDLFWDAYPAKKGKKKACEIWKRKQLCFLSDEIVAKVNEQKNNEKQWKDGYIPNPATYLYQERWNDEITPAQTMYNQEIKKQNEQRIQQIEKRSIDNSKKQFKKGTFKAIVNVVQGCDSSKSPPTKHLNALLEAAGIKRDVNNV